MKSNLPGLRADLGYTAAAALVAMPVTMTNEVLDGLLYYQVVGVCADLATEGPN